MALGAETQFYEEGTSIVTLGDIPMEIAAFPCHDYVIDQNGEIEPRIRVMKADRRWTASRADSNVKFAHFGGPPSRTNRTKPTPILPKVYTEHFIYRI